MIEYRSCAGLDELQACVDLQIETWGYDETDLMPRKAFLLAQKIGGQVIGAFDLDPVVTGATRSSTKLIGFALSLPGVKTFGARPTSYLHSHMLAVRPTHRDRGVGSQLKWKQRDEAFSRGITLMEWTFDPLVIKNAFLNIHKLGATAREYRADFYGVSSSRLQGGLPTDRLVAQWQLGSPRVDAAFRGQPTSSDTIEDRITVPAAIDIWKSEEHSRERALAAQFEVRERFQQAFSRGLAVVGFSRDQDGNGVFALA